MISLGLRLSLRTGRQGVVRLAVTAVAVGIGVTLLLSVLALFHAWQTSVDRPCWECTGPTAANAATPPTLEWRRHDDVWRGTPIVRVDVATLTTDPPTIPGLDRLPGPGEYAASPALARLIASEPADMLAARFPGRLTATIGQAGLSSPDDLVIVVGYDPNQLAGSADRVARISTKAQSFGSSAFYQFGFGLAAVALLVPLMVLIGTATRLSAARREERFAAMRLVGATSGQVALIAAVEAVVAAFAGALLGIVGYRMLHPAIAALPLTGSRFFDATVTPTTVGYVAALVAVPACAAAAALVSLRRVQISPLGVAGKTTPPRPRAWRVLPLAAGVLLFEVPLLSAHGSAPASTPAVVALALILFGIVIAGPWLTDRCARLLARAGSGPASLLAARRMSDNPRAAFRTVTGLVLAVLIGTMLAALVPTALATQQADAASLGNVLRVGFAAGGPPASGCAGPSCTDRQAEVHALASGDAARLFDQLHAIGATAAIPFYVTPHGTAVRCGDLAKLPALGSCAPGTDAVLVDTYGLFVENVSSILGRLPLVTADSTPTAAPAGADVETLLVTMPDDPTIVEHVRTLLSGYVTTADPARSPRTFAEVAHDRGLIYEQAERAVAVLTAITLIVAGCSLAVAVAGSLLERKRPFTLLRLTGTSTSVLRRVVLLETTLPLVGAAILAALVGLVLAYPVDRILEPTRSGIPVPGGQYFAILAVGLTFALAAIAACLPILNQITRPATARFE